MEELFGGLGALALYFSAAIIIVLALFFYVNMPREVFRKLLHGVLLGGLYIWTVKFHTWYLAALSALGFALAAHPVLTALEPTAFFRRIFPQRSTGEFKSSLLVVFVMYAVVTAVCWGWLGDKLLGLCCLFAWGFGDAAAALVGKRFGRHGLQGWHIEGRKSLEGTLAMFVLSFLTVAALLARRGGLPLYGLALTAALTAAVTAVVELYSMKGTDTITCPLAAMAVVLPMVRLFGGLA